MKNSKKKKFKKRLKNLVIYTLSKRCRKDKDIVSNYYRAFLLACKKYHKIKSNENRI